MRVASVWIDGSATWETIQAGMPSRRGPLEHLQLVEVVLGLVALQDLRLGLLGRLDDAAEPFLLAGAWSRWPASGRVPRRGASRTCERLSRVGERRGVGCRREAVEPLTGVRDPVVGPLERLLAGDVGDRDGEGADPFVEGGVSPAWARASCASAGGWWDVPAEACLEVGMELDGRRYLDRFLGLGGTRVLAQLVALALRVLPACCGLPATSAV